MNFRALFLLALTLLPTSVFAYSEGGASSTNSPDEIAACVANAWNLPDLRMRAIKVCGATPDEARCLVVLRRQNFDAASACQACLTEEGALD